MQVTIHVQSQGEIVLPEELCKKYGIRVGDMLHLTDLDGVFILSPIMPIVPEIARELERMRLESGLSTEDLLKSLREQRERYYQEHYANQVS